MKQLTILIASVFAAGAGAIAKAISENPDGAAADIIILAEETAKVPFLEDALSKKNLEVESLTTINDQLSAELEKAPSLADVPDNHTTHSFKQGSKKYGFQFPSMQHKGKPVTYKDVVASKDLQAELVKMGSGMIYEKD